MPNNPDRPRGWTRRELLKVLGVLSVGVVANELAELTAFAQPKEQPPINYAYIYRAPSGARQSEIIASVIRLFSPSNKTNDIMRTWNAIYKANRGYISREMSIPQSIFVPSFLLAEGYGMGGETTSAEDMAAARVVRSTLDQSYDTARAEGAFWKDSYTASYQRWVLKGKDPGVWGCLEGKSVDGSSTGFLLPKNGRATKVPEYPEAQIVPDPDLGLVAISGKTRHYFDADAWKWVEKPPAKRPVETPTAPRPTEVARPEAMNIAGLNKVWNNGRWEYTDISGQNVAFWDAGANQGKGKIELAPGLTSLDFEKHKGLFVGWTPQQVEAAILAEQKKENVAYALPLDPTVSGGIIEEGTSLASFLCFRNLKKGTSVRALVSGTVNKYGLTSGVGIQIISGSRIFEFIFPKGTSFASVGGTIEAGSRITSLSEATLPSGFGHLGTAYQFILDAQNSATQKGINTSLNNLLRDASGMLVYIK
jgi:hypothetical protein